MWRRLLRLLKEEGELTFIPQNPPQKIPRGDLAFQKWERRYVNIRVKFSLKWADSDRKTSVGATGF